MEPKEPQIAKTILRSKNKAGGILLTNFKMHDKSRVIKNSMVLA